MPIKTGNQQLNKRRAIRSFVRREGRMTPSQQLALDQLWPKYGINASKSILNWEDVFTQSGPVSIDIGFGNGLSTFYMATLQTHWNHLGIEVYRSGIGSLFKKIDKQHLENVRVICEDAVVILNEMIANHCVDRFVVFFPDPWHKKRHHKRRLIQNDFVSLMASKLKKGGIIHLATDWEPYALWMLEVMQAHHEFENTADSGQFCEKPQYRPVTKFETRGSKLGHQVFDLIYRRI